MDSVAKRKHSEILILSPSSTDPNLDNPVIGFYFPAVLLPFTPRGFLSATCQPYINVYPQRHLEPEGVATPRGLAYRILFSSDAHGVFVIAVASCVGAGLIVHVA